VEGNKPPSASESMISLDRSIMNAGPTLLPDAGSGPVSDAERIKYESERAKLYSQLDEKDDEIQSASQMSERLKQQMAEQEELIKAAKLDYETAQAEMSRIQSENEAAKEEVKEVLQALEELAMNYDQKTQEADFKSKENETLGEEVHKQLVSSVLSLSSSICPFAVGTERGAK
jgi:kinesin family protein 5